MAIIHDHLYVCRSCDMTIFDGRDCICPNTRGLTYELCGHCRMEQDYNRQEAKRNADF